MPLTPEQQKRVVDYMPLAASIARKFSRRSRTSFDELESDAMLGLCEAAERYDPTRPNAWPAYARQYISGRINDGERRRTADGAASGNGFQNEIIDLRDGDPAAIAEAKDEFEFVQRHLPRKKFARSKVDALKQGVIAAKAGISRPAANSRLRNARRILENIEATGCKPPKDVYAAIEAAERN